MTTRLKLMVKAGGAGFARCSTKYHDARSGNIYSRARFHLVGPRFLHLELMAVNSKAIFTAILSGQHPRERCANRFLSGKIQHARNAGAIGIA